MPRNPKGAGKPSQLRIIGGQWRGRKLTFQPRPGLRPTTDRVRETLFNWLAPELHGARCADLFAGSGALGLEALSRGAGHCDFVDQSPQVIAQLRRHLKLLEAETSGHFYAGSALDFLTDVTATAYDLVFIDPPFGQALIDPTCIALADGGLLTPGALVYIEAAIQDEMPGVPHNWLEYRSKRAGGVAYRLFRVE